jgi:hypothetical protein
VLGQVQSDYNADPARVQALLFEAVGATSVGSAQVPCSCRDWYTDTKRGVSRRFQNIHQGAGVPCSSDAIQMRSAYQGFCLALWSGLCFWCRRATVLTKVRARPISCKMDAPLAWKASDWVPSIINIADLIGFCNRNVVLCHLVVARTRCRVAARSDQSLLHFWVNSDIILMNTGCIVVIEAAGAAVELGCSLRRCERGVL